MRYLLAIVILLSFSISANAQASDSLSSYILQKQLQATTIKRAAELRAQHWGNQDSANIVNITPIVKTEEVAMKPPSAEDLDAIETAAGKKPSEETASKAAKTSIKK